MCSTILFLGCIGEDSRRRSQLFGALVCFECIWRREKTKMSSHSSQNQLFKFPPTISTQHLISSLLDKYLPVKFWFRTVNGFRMSLIFTDNELSTKAIWSYSCTCARRTECSRQQILDAIVYLAKVKWSKVDLWPSLMYCDHIFRVFYSPSIGWALNILEFFISSSSPFSFKSWKSPKYLKRTPTREFLLPET